MTQRLIVNLNGLRPGDKVVGIQLDGPAGALVPVPGDFVVKQFTGDALQFDKPKDPAATPELEAVFREAITDETAFHIVRTTPDLSAVGDLGPISPPDGRLHLLLIASAFQHLADSADANSSEPGPAAVGASMSQWLEIELLDTSRIPTSAGIQAVTLLALAYTKAAEQVHAINTDRSTLQQDGINQAATWLQTQAETFATLAAKLTNIDHPKEPHHRI